MKKVILALAICATIASCQKKEDTDPIDVSKTTYLMDGSWRMKVYTWLPDITDSAGIPVNIYTPIAGCQKDNYFTFYSINRTSLYEGGSKCNIAAQDSVIYGYKLTQDDKHLEIYNNPDEANHSVLLAGDMTYPTMDSFVVTYTAPNPTDSTKTSRYVRAYVKQ